MSTGAIGAIERLLAESDEADDALRGAVATLVAEPEIDWAGIGFVEGDAIALGPAAGVPDESRRKRVPILFSEALVGELLVDGDVDPSLLEQVAARLAPHVLIGWDTGGEAWEP